MPSPFVFLSHSGADSDAALALARRLEESPLGRRHRLRVWVDKKDLIPGPGWKDQLQAALARSTAFAVYVGSKRVVNWVWDEVSVALDRAHKNAGYPVIPILATQARFDELPSFLSQRQCVSDVERNGDAFTALLRGLLGLDARTLVEAEQEPFQGLEAFTSRRAHLFFGRESDTDELLDLVRTEPLVAVVGDSGSGKSSLVKAGLVPRFRGGALAGSSLSDPDETVWRVLESRPLYDPFEKLAEAVLAEAQAYGKGITECSALADLVRSRKSSSIKDAIHLSGPSGATAKTLMIVDQFEELFTLADADGQAAFADVLVSLADSADDAIRIVLTMRWDYYHLCSNTPQLYTRLEAHNRRARYTLRRMPANCLRQCVTEPLRLAGVPEPERETLATSVLNDVGERPNDLALLEMALRHAWTKRAQHEHELLTAYLAIGRVDGALATAADEVVASLTPDEQSLVEPLFIRLVKLGDTGGATRRIANRDELDNGRWELAQRLAMKECYRLVVVAGNTVEIAHEAMVTSWPRYVAWLRNDPKKNDIRVDDKRHLDALVDDAQRWTASSETERAQYLAHGFDLERYEELRGRRPSWLCQIELSFIEASTSERHRVRQKEYAAGRTLKRRAYIAAFLGCVALVLSLVVVGYAYHAWRQSKAATIASVIRTAASMVDSDPTAAALVLATLTADSELDYVMPIATQVAHGSLATILRGHAGSVFSAVFSPDNTRIATAGEDGTARIWRADGTGEPVILRGHAGSVFSAVFSPDSTRVVTAGHDGSARIWHVDGTGEPVVLRHAAVVRSAAFSSDNARIVTAGDDGTARLWRADGAGESVVLGRASSVVSAAFSRGNTRIVTVAEDGTTRVSRADGTGGPVVLGHEGRGSLAAISQDETRVITVSVFDSIARVWRADGTGEPVILGQPSRVLSAAFSTDDTRIVTTGSDGTARVWRADGTGEPVVLRGHGGLVLNAAFSPDNKRIVTAGEDGTVRVWRVHGAVEPVILSGHKGPLTSGAFSRDNTRIVTAGFDGSARVWRADGTGEPIVLRGHLGRVLSAAFSPDNTRIVTSGDDGTMRLWRADGTGEPVILQQRAVVRSAAFSPDNTRIVTASYDGSARLWRADGTGELAVLRGHAGRVLSAAFSTDSTRIVTAGDDGTARVWRADGTGEPVTLRGHAGWVFSAVFSPDNTRVVTAGDDGTARVWRADGTGEPIVLRHGLRVRSAAFSSDNARIVTAGDDGTARLWRADGTGELVVLRGHAGAVGSASFNPDNTRIVTIGDDGTARVWHITWPALLEILRSETKTCLTIDERRRYVGESESDARQAWKDCESANGRSASR
jgi:WD40 repeat protein